MPLLIHPIVASLKSSSAMSPEASISSPVLNSPVSHQRLEQLEHQIRQHQGQDLPTEWLNEYLDIGLELANQQDVRLKPLQESWLTRMYNTLRDAALNPRATGSWRHLCLDYLYQPFFVLTQIYRHQPQKSLRLKSLRNEFAMINRLV